MRTIFLILIFINLNGLALPQSTKETSRSPNFIVFFTDDMGWGDLGSFGHPTIRTPNLDQLAKEGQRWTDFYVVESVCSPSRAALLTGRLPVRSGLFGYKLPVFFENEPYGFPKKEITLAEHLKPAGYQSAIIGKWHLGDLPHSFPTRHGFDYWFGIPYSNDLNFVKGPSRDRIVQMLSEKGHEKEMDAFYHDLLKAYAHPKPEYWNVPVYESFASSSGVKTTLIEQPLKQSKLTQYITEKAVSFIKNNDSRPFFLYVPYAKPHKPIFPAEKFRGKSQAGLYGDAIEEIDWSVGQIIGEVRKQGLEHHTMVLFTSDNGPLKKTKEGGGSTGPFRGTKRTTLEGGMRTPAIFWWPGTILPGTQQGIGSIVDIFPTFVKASGLKMPNVPFDGKNLIPTLKNQKNSPRTTMPYFLAGKLWAFRSGPYKLQLIAKGKKESEIKNKLVALKNPRLYHLGVDPQESFDISSSHKKEVKRIKKEIKKFLKNLPFAEPLFDRRLNKN